MTDRERIAQSHRPDRYYNEQEAECINELDRRAGILQESLASFKQECELDLAEDLEHNGQDSLYAMYMERRVEVMGSEVASQSFIVQRFWGDRLNNVRDKLTDEEVKVLESCTGTNLQLHMHEEYLDFFDSILEIEDAWPEDPLVDRESLRSIALDGATGNRLGYVEKSSKVLDFCWSTLDFISSCGSSLGPGARQALLIAQARLEGAGEGVAAILKDLCHPVEYLKGEVRFYKKLAIVLKECCELGVAKALGDEEWYELNHKKFAERFNRIKEMCVVISQADDCTREKMIARMVTECIVRRKLTASSCKLIIKAASQLPAAAEALKTAGAAAGVKCNQLAALIAAAKPFRKMVKHINSPVPTMHLDLNFLNYLARTYLVPLKHLPPGAVKDAFFDISHLLVGKLDSNGVLKGFHHLMDDLGGPISKVVEVTEKLGKYACRAKIISKGGVSTAKSLFISLTQEELIRSVRDALCACTKPWAHVKKSKGTFTKVIKIYGVKTLVVYKHSKILSFYPL